MAQELGVARQTLVLGDERLAAEGSVRGRTGSGTSVATDPPDQAPVPAIWLLLAGGCVRTWMRRALMSGERRRPLADVALVMASPVR